MSDQYNPFKDNRAEQMKDLWKYYVPFDVLEGSGKPIVVEGGRGSGKTMFFQCNSWREKSVELQKNSRPIADLIQDDYIGIYYRVDTTFVASMKNGGVDNWDKVFETYLAICLLKEILDFLIEISSSTQIDEKELRLFVTSFSSRLSAIDPPEDIYMFRNNCERYLDAIEDLINGVACSFELRFLNVNRYINDVCSFVLGLLNNKDLIFKIFIDEYETLQVYQQRIVNTLIKHSTVPVIYNIGLKPHGMRTIQTISETETIEAPHDYEIVELGFEGANYSQLLKEICRKRIELGKDQGKIPADASDDIEYYLGKYSIEYEMNLIGNSKNISHVSDLRELIKEKAKKEGDSDSDVEKYIDVLCDKADLLHSRIHYALLIKDTHYTPSLSELYYECIHNSKRYQEWVHNRKHGAVYLLCKETKRKKMYFGFDVFTMLSSNNVRGFLELCEQAFKLSFLDGYQWDSPISPEVQTNAAIYVSDYKVTEIAGYEPFGRELRIFVQYLGKIFYALHTEKDSTIGEPEPNHFSTNDLSLSPEIKSIIASALLCNVLQEGEANKKKQSMRSSETVDYHINKLYTPYFGISYRDQRKIFLSVDILTLLLDGSEDSANKALRQFTINNKKSNGGKKDRKKKEKRDWNNEAKQISLFESDPEE